MLLGPMRLLFFRSFSRFQRSAPRFSDVLSEQVGCFVQP